MQYTSTIKQLLAAASLRLADAKVDSPRLSAELLLAETLKKDRLWLITHAEDTPAADSLCKFEEFIRRREGGEPVAYLLGHKEFFSREFVVTHHTLIPRPETELLVESALQNSHLLPADAPLTFADLGTGTGCIAITIAAERPCWHGVAVDISAEALKTAAHNALHHGVSDRLCFIRADFCQPLFQKGSLELLISNPPYISQQEYHELSCEVRKFEPAGALIPGGNTQIPCTGLEHAEKIILNAEYALKPGGVLLIEHGFAQRTGMQTLLKSNIWNNIIYHNDLSGKPRFIQATRRADMV